MQVFILRASDDLYSLSVSLFMQFHLKYIKETIKHTIHYHFLLHKQQQHIHIFFYKRKSGLRIFSARKLLLQKIHLFISLKQPTLKPIPKTFLRKLGTLLMISIKATGDDQHETRVYEHKACTGNELHVLSTTLATRKLGKETQKCHQDSSLVPELGEFLPFVTTIRLKKTCLMLLSYVLCTFWEFLCICTLRHA